MPTVGQGIRNLAMEGPKTVTLAIASGGNTDTYTFDAAFTATPGLLIIKPRAADGTWSFTNLTASGFDFDISGVTGLDGTNIEVGVFAHEEL